MKTFAAIGLAALALAACGRHDHDQSGGKQDEGPPGTAITRWTDRTELFLEHKLLVADRETSFAVHLTELAGFKPVIQGSVALEFEGTGGRSVSEPGPSRHLQAGGQAPGGAVPLKLVVLGPQVRDTHDLGESGVPVGRSGARGEPGASHPDGYPSLRSSSGRAASPWWRSGAISPSLRVQGQVGPAQPPRQSRGPGVGRL